MRRWREKQKGHLGDFRRRRRRSFAPGKNLRRHEEKEEKEEKEETGCNMRPENNTRENISEIEKDNWLNYMC